MQQTITDALAITLDDEYRARATYRAVLDKFGSVPPFINIIEAEERHIMALLALHSAYGVIPPVDRWINQVAIPDTLAACCQAGIDAEISNYALYDNFLTWVQPPDIRQVFINLRDASEFNHLPAFQHCLERAQRSNATITSNGASMGLGTGSTNSLAQGMQGAQKNNATLWMLGGLLTGAALIYYMQRSKVI